MLLHIGENEGIPLERVVLVLNAGNLQPETAEYIERARKGHRCISCNAEPKSYVLTRQGKKELIFESMIASATLEKRWKAQLSGQTLREALR